VSHTAVALRSLPLTSAQAVNSCSVLAGRSLRTTSRFGVRLVSPNKGNRFADRRAAWGGCGCGVGAHMAKAYQTSDGPCVLATPRAGSASRTGDILDDQCLGRILDIASPMRRADTSAAPPAANCDSPMWDVLRSSAGATVHPHYERIECPHLCILLNWRRRPTYATRRVPLAGSTFRQAIVAQRGPA